MYVCAFSGKSASENSVHAEEMADDYCRIVLMRHRNDNEYWCDADTSLPRIDANGNVRPVPNSLAFMPRAVDNGDLSTTARMEAENAGFPVVGWPLPGLAQLANGSTLANSIRGDPTPQNPHHRVIRFPASANGQVQLAVKLASIALLEAEQLAVAERNRLIAWDVVADMLRSPAAGKRWAYLNSSRQWVLYTPEQVNDIVQQKSVSPADVRVVVADTIHVLNMHTHWGHLQTTAVCFPIRRVDAATANALQVANAPSAASSSAPSAALSSSAPSASSSASSSTCPRFGC